MYNNAYADVSSWVRGLINAYAEVSSGARCIITPMLTYPVVLDV